MTGGLRLLVLSALLAVWGFDLRAAALPVLENVPAGYPVVIGGDFAALHRAPALAGIWRDGRLDAHRPLLDKYGKFCLAIALDGNWLLFGLPSSSLDEVRAALRRENPPETVRRSADGQAMYCYRDGRREIVLRTVGAQLVMGTGAAAAKWRRPDQIAPAVLVAQRQGLASRLTDNRIIGFAAADGTLFAQVEKASAGGANPFDGIEFIVFGIWSQGKSLVGDLCVGSTGEQAAAQLTGQLRMMFSLMVPMAFGSDPQLGEMLMGAVNFRADGRNARARVILSERDIARLTDYLRKNQGASAPGAGGVRP